EQHHPVRHTHRNNLSVRRASEPSQTWCAGASEQTQCSAAMAEIVEWPARPVSRITRIVRVDEITLEIAPEVLWNGAVIGIEARVEMGDPYPLPIAGILGRPECGVELTVGYVAEPIVVLWIAGVTIADVLRMLTTLAHFHTGAGGLVDSRYKPTLLEIRFGEQESFIVLQQRIADVPRVYASQISRCSCKMPDRVRCRRRSSHA